MLTTYIKKLLHHENLSQEECHLLIDELLLSNNTPQISAILMLLRAKSETAEEIFALTSALREKMQTITPPFDVLDIVGTGGDQANLINISTGSAILASSCGVKILKHGNRAASSQCGSADVLEALGVNIEMSQQHIQHCLEQIGFSFCYAPLFHPALKHLRTIRSQLNMTSTFNILGPLLHPARATYYLMGVFDERLLQPVAHALRLLNVKHAMIFHSHGTDELCSVVPAYVIEVVHGSLNQFILDPKSFGFTQGSLHDLRGGNAHTNATRLLNIFSGEECGAGRDTLIFNAGVACYVYGIVSSIAAGIELARKKLMDGSATHLLQEFIALSHSSY